ncbi:hypothetical protein [Neorhizobium galegae]|uniref:hypothetical protein n=1 Tax=Neorhizobium galegae TaxID=399 RepID=UPI0006218E93|nr:hypothetical protein [Neorhizobium galegae]CDZ55057.1 Hypothetical protein NGAL_HAMBI2427_59690 [Neorhizobium galegae bv. orientalis]
MTIHYHGLPLTPEVMLYDLAGRHVCISYATKRAAQVAIALRIMQSCMFDNGQYTLYQQGGKEDVYGFYDWIDPMLGHPHWAVVPDRINGDVDQQRALVKTWPFPRELGAPVWHLHLPIDYLLELIDEWPRVCLGSSKQYWQVGAPIWRRRMDEVTEAVYKRRRQAPWIHGLRMMAQLGKGWCLASGDSVNTARNYKDREEMPHVMAERIDRVNNQTVAPMLSVLTNDKDVFA